MNRQTSEIGGGTQPQVFVSYARQDAEKVLTITRLLEAEGATVWRDGSASWADSTTAKRLCTQSPTRGSSC